MRVGIRRSWPRAVALGVLASALASCTNRSPVSTAPVTLIVAQSNDPGSLNPAITTSGNVHPVTDQIFNGLVGLDERMQPVAELAERWTTEEGGRRYTFHLRRDVTWHDGRPFTSADVEFTFEKVLLEYHSRTRAALRPLLDGIDTPDAHTVVFRFKEPYAPLLQRLDVVEASILPQHVYAGTDVLTAAANLAPVGTGPFRFVSYRKGEVVELARNPAYFRAGRPKVDRLVFRITPSSTTGVMALERGEIDYLPSVPGSEIERLRNRTDIAIVQASGGSGGSFCQDVVIPNHARPSLADRRVRQAIYHAVNRPDIVARVYFGQGAASTGPISQYLEWVYTSDTRQYPFDRLAAERLLDEAGLRRQGRDPRLRLTFTHPSTAARLGQALREALGHVGIELALEALDFNASVEKTFVRKDFDLGFASYCNGADPEIGVRRVYDSGNIAPIPFSNGAGYRSPRVDQLLHQAATSVDRNARAATYRLMQQVLADDLPYFWIIDSRGARANRTEFTGFRAWTGAFAETVAAVPAASAR